MFGIFVFGIELLLA